MKVRICLVTLLAAVLFVGCKSDDDKSTPAPPANRVQVTTVFAPGQLGDMGYADRVMKGLKGTRVKGREIVVDYADRGPSSRSPRGGEGRQANV